MKRIISLVLAVSMVLSMCVTAFAASKYTDLKGNNAKFAGAVEALTELGVVDGFTDNTFGPEKELTRAQLAKMLVICLGLGDSVESLTGKTVFSDVAASHWAAGYINAAAQSKVITGYPDGTFKPEKNVTYAEAFTMALRALGYGNVVEAEGTWPTAYMLKAVELELTDDMDGTIVAGNPALRGNTAILLWNMLRTPMWKIYQESQGNGMTLEARDDFMLNVKFPKYTYGEKLYLEDIEVKDKDEVRIEVRGYDEDGFVVRELEGKLNRDVDVSRLVINERVTVLVKDYKDSEKATFLTLVPEYDFVEGFVTKLEDDIVEVNGVEYKIGKNDVWSADVEEVIDVDQFIVLEVDGKKVVSVDDVIVAKILPNEGTEVTKPSALKSKIDEDDLVIIDGKWASRDDIEAGDVYTELGDAQVGGTYFMVARERVEGSFESLTYEKDSDERMYFEVDGDEYKTMKTKLKVYETEDKDPVDIDDLTKKKKENDYLDKDISLVLNYLNLVVKAYFGDVQGNGGSPFYGVMSNGVREITDPETGDSALKVRLAGSEDKDGTLYTMSKKFDDPEAFGYGLDKGTTFRRAREDDEHEVTFAWAKFNDKEEVKEIEIVADGESYDDGRYDAIGFNEEEIDDNYLAGYKIAESTVVYKLTPILEDDEDVVGFKFDIAEDARKALQGVDKGIIIVDNKDKVNQNGNIMVAAYVFIMEEAISSDLEIAKVSATKQRAGISYIKVNGEWEEVDLDSNKSIVDAYTGSDSGNVEDLKDEFAIFSRTESEKVVVRGTLKAADVANAQIVKVYKKPIIQFHTADVLPEDIDLEDKTNDPVKTYANHKIVAVSATVDKKGKLEFSDGETLGTGLPEGKYAKGDRVYVYEENGLKVVFIVSIDGVDEKDRVFESGDDVYVEFSSGDVDLNANI